MAHSPYFQERAVPDETRLAGWTALVKELTIPAPVRQPSCVSEKHVKGSQRERRGWRIFDKRYWPGESFADHLNFAFRCETLDLLILKRVFERGNRSTGSHCAGSLRWLRGGPMTGVADVVPGQLDEPGRTLWVRLRVAPSDAASAVHLERHAGDQPGLVRN